MRNIKERLSRLQNILGEDDGLPNSERVQLIYSTTEEERIRNHKMKHDELIKKYGEKTVSQSRVIFLHINREKEVKTNDSKEEG